MLKKIKPPQLPEKKNMASAANLLDLQLQRWINPSFEVAVPVDHPNGTENVRSLRILHQKKIRHAKLCASAEVLYKSYHPEESHIICSYCTST